MRLHFAKCMAAAYARVGLCAGVLALPSIPFERLPQANLLNYALEYRGSGSCITITRTGRWLLPAEDRHVDAVYEPNSFEGAEQDPALRRAAARISGNADRYNATAMTTTARLPRRSICSTPGQKQRLFENVAETM
jgi:hypothetical protein